jgi:Holliday junction resolvasome RuvABC endonuclease subunit
VTTEFCAVGLDLSYTSTGMCALWASRPPVTEALRYKGSLDHPGERLAFLFAGVERFIATHRPTAVLAERPFNPPPPKPLKWGAGLSMVKPYLGGDPSMGIKLGMLHGAPMASAWRHGAQFQHVEPAAYRAAVLGFVPKGDDVKKQVAARLRLFGFEFATDDEADAYCVARWGLDLLRRHNGLLPPVVTQATRRREKKKAIKRLLAKGKE